MAMTREGLLDRVRAVCEAAPFEFKASPLPFSFDTVPSPVLDGAYRVEIAQQSVTGYFGFSEETTDLVTVFVARSHKADAQAAYRQLMQDLRTLRAAIAQDGAVASGEYVVVDGGSASVQHVRGQDFAVARLALSINYEVEP